MPEQGPNVDDQPKNPSSQLWIPLFEDYVEMAPTLGTPQEFMRDAGYKLFEYVRDGLAPDLGAIQDHFNSTQYYVQLTSLGRLAAAKFMFGVHPDKVTSHHPFTEESKKFGLAISIGHDSSNLGEYLAMQRSNHARNIRNLREDTGLFNVDDPDKLDLNVSASRKL